MIPTFYLMVGLPGSGKSTYWNTLSKQSDDIAYLSTDEYVQVRADAEEKTYDDMWADLIGEATEFVHKSFRELVKDGADIVWDQTNLGVKKRKRVLSQVPQAYRKVAVVVSCDESVRQRRLLQRPGKTIPPHVDKSMMDSFVMPTLDEGFDEIVEVRT